jgi:hypothetical protein
LRATLQRLARLAKAETCQSIAEHDIWIAPRGNGRERILKIRSITVISQEILSEGGRDTASPVKRVAACAVLHNPFAGKPTTDDFSKLIDISVETGELLTARALPRWRRSSRAAMARRRWSAPPAISNMAPA